MLRCFGLVEGAVGVLLMFSSELCQRRADGFDREIGGCFLVLRGGRVDGVDQCRGMWKWNWLRKDGRMG